MKEINQERAERIARAHACEHCGEYSFRKMKVKPASEGDKKNFGEIWHISKTCGVCGMEHEMGIDAEGDIVYAI